MGVSYLNGEVFFHRLALAQRLHTAQIVIQIVGIGAIGINNQLAVSACGGSSEAAVAGNRNAECVVAHIAGIVQHRDSGMTVKNFIFLDGEVSSHRYDRRAFRTCHADGYRFLGQSPVFVLDKNGKRLFAYFTGIDDQCLVFNKAVGIFAIIIDAQRAELPRNLLSRAVCRVVVAHIV